MAEIETASIYLFICVYYLMDAMNPFSSGLLVLFTSIGGIGGFPKHGKFTYLYFNIALKMARTNKNTH